MRNLFSIFALLVLVNLFVSCGDDDDKVVEKIADNLKFIGKFIGEVKCEGDLDEYPTTIDISAKDNSDSKVNVIMETDGDIVVMSGTANENNLVIDKEEVEDETFLSGSGTLSSNTLTVIFTLEESGTISNDCVFIGVK